MAPQETEQDRVEPRGLSECSQYARRDHRLLTGSRLGQLNGCDRREAERPILQSLSTRHDVVGPKAEWLLLGSDCGQADVQRG
jgi:hypothetical protein